MAIEEKEAQETLLKELIEKVEKDPIPTHIFTTEDTDPLVLLGKLNEIIAKLKDLRALYISSDAKATQALDNAINALANATQALQSANTALSTANTAIDTANTALDTANTAIDISNDAVDTATALGNEAKETAETLGTQANNKADNAVNQANEALRVAQEALSQIVEGLGSKVYDISGNLLANAKFKGDNGINVDMSEDDPETFDIRLDDTITKAIEDNNTLAQNNKSSIESINEDITGIKQAQASDSLAIVELQSKNLTQDEEIADLQGNVTANSQKLQRALLLPVSTPSEQKLVGVGTDNVQDLLNIGDNLEVKNGDIKLKDIISLTDAVLQGYSVFDVMAGLLNRDYIIEQGTRVDDSNNWHAGVKWSNGLQICFGRRYSETTANDVVTTMYYGYTAWDKYSVTFGFQDSSTTQLSFRVTSAYSRTERSFQTRMVAKFPFYYVAVGFWK